MAEINISNLGGGGGGTLTLTTTGTGGASTYVAGVLNIPVYQSQLTNPVTGTGTATRVAFWNTASSVSSSANLYWDDSNSRLGVGTATPGARLQVNGTGLTSGTTGLSVKDSGGTDNLTVTDDGAVFVRGVLTVTGSSASNATTLMGRTVSGEVTSVTLGTNLSFSGNTLNSTGGGGSPAGSTGQVQFNNAGAFGASSNLFWDNANVRLGVSTSVPAANIDINTPLSNTSNLLDVTHNSVLRTRLERTGRQTWYVGTLPSTIIGSVAYETPGGNPGIIIRTGSAGLNRFNIINHGTFFNLEYDAVAYGLIYFQSRNLLISGSLNPPTDANYRLDIQSTGATAGGLRVTSSGSTSGTNALLVRNSNGNEIIKLQDNTKVNFFATNTAAGTTGNVTIDRPSGTVNFAAAASALTVTNALCTTSSIVFATVRTNDTTAYIKNVVPGAGSFTINLGSAATAETSVGFWIIN